MQLYFDDVSDDPEQVARARRAPEAEAELEALGFLRAGLVRHRLSHFGHPPMHPKLRDEVVAVWRDPEDKTLAVVDRAWDSDNVTLYSLSVDGHQVRTVWQQDDAVEFASYAPYDPTGPRPDLTEDDLARRVALGREAVQEAFDRPTARIHHQYALMRSLAEALDLHGQRCRTATQASWMAMPATGAGILENRVAQVVATSPGVARVIRRGSSSLVMLLAGSMLIVVGLQVAGWLIDDPRESGLAGLWAGAAPGVGVVFGSLVHQWRTTRELVPGTTMGPPMSSVLLSLLVAGATLYTLVTEPGMLALSAVVLLALGGALGVWGSEGIGRRREERDAELEATWDGLDGEGVVARYGGPALEQSSPRPDHLGLLNQGWTRVGQTEWGSQAPAFTFLSFIDGRLPESTPVPIEVFISPDRRTAARVVAVDGRPFVSLVSRGRDGTWIETRSLPDPGPGSYYSASSTLSAEAWRRRRWWPSEAAIEVSSHPEMGLLVEHVEGTTDVLIAHEGREGVERAEPLVDPQHLWTVLRPLRSSVPFGLPFLLLPLVSSALCGVLVLGGGVGGDWGSLIAQSWIGSTIGWALTARAEDDFKTMLLGAAIAAGFAWPGGAETWPMVAVAIGASLALYTLWIVAERIPLLLAVRRTGSS